MVCPDFRFMFLHAVVVVFFHQSSGFGSPEYEVLQNLFKSYSRLVRPVQNHSSVLDVTYGAALYQMINFDVKQETISNLLWQRVYWTDEFLQWDPEDFGGVHTIRVSQKSIWMPDLLSFKDIGVYDGNKHDSTVPISVTYLGEVTWLVPVSMETICMMDVTAFPFDTQKCEIQLGSWQFTANEVDIHCKSDSLDLFTYTHHNQWLLKETSCERVESTYRTGTYSSIIFKLTYERMFSFYIRNIILPNSILLFLSGLTFFIPCDMGDRIGFGVTVTLALCVNLIIVIDFVPETSKTIPDLCNYFLVSIFLSGLSLITATVSLNVNQGPSHVNKLRNPNEQSLNNPRLPNEQIELEENKKEDSPKFMERVAVTETDDKKSSFRFMLNLFSKLCSKIVPRMGVRQIDLILGVLYMLGSTMYTLAFLLTLRAEG